MTPAPGREAITEKGWWPAHQWLILRRGAQFGVLGAFLLGPWFGAWVVKGNLNASRTLEVLPLTDPYVLLQSLLARHVPELTAVVGALIVLGFYFLVGGRSYCAWVCPLNVVTDAAAWLRRRLGIAPGAHFRRATRYWILAATLLVSALMGSVAWELVNPVSLLHRGLIFGMGAAWGVVLAVFMFDLLVSRRGWCGHLCPVGAFYSLLGVYRPLHVSARRRSACNDCMDCYAVCPEPQIISPALKGDRTGGSPLIHSALCTHCGRCIDVCSKRVFEFHTYFGNKTETAT
jgi:ferredoxin-type protein NapH